MAILLVIIVIRFVTVGSITNKIDTLEKENITLQKQITELNVIVQDNRNAQTDYIYELNKFIPAIYSGETLEYKIVSKLERLGISEAKIFDRAVVIDETVKLDKVEQLIQYKNAYGVVEIMISFTTQDVTDISNLLDSMFEEEVQVVISPLSTSVESTHIL